MAGKAVLLQERLDGCLELMGGGSGAGHRSGRGVRVRGPGGKLVDPAGDQIDLLRWQRIAAHGHQGLALAPQIEQKRTLGTLARNDRRAFLVASGQQGLNRLHPQPALGRFRPVTGEAMGLENRPNVGFETGAALLRME